MWRCRADRLRDALLFDIRVKRIVHHLAAWVLHLADEPRGVGRAVEEIALEPVERLDGERHAGLAGMLGDLPHALDAPLPFVAGRPRAAEVTERRMKGPANRLGAQRLAAIDRPLVGGDARRAHLIVWADRIV